MKNRIIKTTITFALSLCCIFSFLTISKAHEVYASYYRYVNANSLIVRKTASSKGKVMGSYKKGTKLKCFLPISKTIFNKETHCSYPS